MTKMQKTLYRRLLKEIITNNFNYRGLYNFAKYKIAMLNKMSRLNVSPLSVQFFVNKTCNLNCEFCYYASDLNLKDAKDYNLTTERMKEFLDLPFIKGCLRIGLTGGEPFLNKEIFPIIKLIKERGYILSVVSNGILIDRMLEDVNKSRIDVLGLSLYDESIDKIADLIPKLDQNIFIKTHRVIFADKLNDIEEVVRFSVEHKAHGILFNNYFTFDKDQKNRAVFDDNKEFFEIKKEIDRKYSKDISIQWCPAFPRNSYKKKCRLVFHHIELDAKGNIAPCCFAYPDGEKYGNVLKEPDAWNNSFFIKLRESLLRQDLPVHPLCRDCAYLYENLYGL